MPHTPSNSGGSAGNAPVGGSTAANQLAGFSNTLVPTVGTAAYIPGDCLGNVATLTFPTVNFSTGRNVAIDSIFIYDKSNQSPAMTIMWFKQTPAGGTYTDGAPLVLAAADADLPNIVGITKILAGDWLQVPSISSTGAIVNFNDLNLNLPIAATSLFALIQCDSTLSLTASDIGITISGRKL